MIFFLSLNSFAGNLEKIIKSYKNEQYWKSCDLCEKSLSLYEKNSDFLNFCSLSCLKSGELEKMGKFASLLGKKASDRKNSVYFLTILYQKKLLLNSILDKADISFVKLPKTNYILSDIFIKYVKKDFTKRKNVYLFKDDEDPKITYKLSVQKMDGENKLFLKTFKGKILIKTRIY
ncbi:MAG: hypothetical protein GXO31_02355 [Epsilonproteobacteria bacterium]|nr:hypothetical protein [Campylobacterota bacterium]